MEKEYIKLSFVGDIMCKKQQIEASRKPNNEYNFDKCLSGIKHFFEKSDYISGNLETPITKNNLGLTEQNFSFNTPMEFAKAIKNNNINLLTTANNHALDRGKKGLLETLECLEDLSIEHIGTYKSKEERNLFLKLINVKGLGPKMALPMVSAGSVNDLLDAISQENLVYLTKFPKIGDKLARQIILDLKGKLADHQDLFAASDLTELVAVLESLGYKKADINKILPKVDATKSLENQVKEALRLLLSK